MRFERVQSEIYRTLLSLFFYFIRGKGYNLGRIKRGPQKIGSGIYLVYDDGDACDGGGNYSSRIEMQCGSTKVCTVLLFINTSGPSWPKADYH